jgi:hypothetical protein
MLCTLMQRDMLGPAVTGTKNVLEFRVPQTAPTPVPTKKTAGKPVKPTGRWG